MNKKYLIVLYVSLLAGLEFPDFDLHIFAFLGHRSILTHGIIIPYLLYKFLTKDGGLKSTNKFFGRFFSSKMADELIPRIKNEKKEDPEYSILPIIARDLKHVKGHLSFMQVRRDIRGKRGGDNWQIHEYTNPQQGKLNNTNHDLNFDDGGSSSITNSRNSRGNRSYNNIRDV